MLKYAVQILDKKNVVNYLYLNHITYTYFHLYSLFSMGNDIIIVASTTMYYTSSFSSEYLLE